ncbi:MAG: hydrogenase expression/formation protein HypE [Candidatus Omnitrophica bacterium]|nr:hydrogenase expression/formation protein HypE [Candidatus Omnitrophota bacterium]
MDRITISHGSGGKAMHSLIDSLFMKELGNSILRRKSDSAVVKVGSEEIAFTTDSYVVKPIIFPGGDIGSLAVHGTVNDLSVCGARPLYLSLGLVIEEGLDKKTLTRIIKSINAAAKIAGVLIVTGDTKVVEKGSCDKIFINTSGIGKVYYSGLSTDKIRPQDVVIVSGSLGEHAIAVLSKREGISFGTNVKSDSSSLNGMIAGALKVSQNIRLMRDPTRGGLGTTLNEIVSSGRFGIALEEKDIPVSEGVREACELLGFDSLYLACEGRAVFIAAPQDAGKVLKALRRDRLGEGSRVIGRITSDHKGKVYMRTTSGGLRLVDMLSGEQLPRIC